MPGSIEAAIRLGSLALLLCACSTPVGIEVTSPREVQRYLTRSALTEDTPSDFSKNELRRYSLLEVYEEEPLTALAKLREAAIAEGLPQQTLFALAELWFLQAEDDEQQPSYAAAVIYAWAFLFPEGDRAPTDRLDPRERITADLYNRALTLAFKRTKEGTLALSGSGKIVLPFGMLTVTVTREVLHENGYELYDLLPVAELQVSGFRNRYRQPGIGAPLAAKTRPLPGIEPVISTAPGARVPITAVLLIDQPLLGIRTGTLTGRLEMVATLESTTIAIDGVQVPLESEPTAALAAGLTETQFWKNELTQFFGNAIGVRKSTNLIGLRPYKNTRIPAVFVHGTASSPARWANMVNDMLADPRLRDRYAFWLFSYDSGNPIGYSGHQLRAALTEAVHRADPDGKNPCTEDMIVLGHSQGGLLTKLTAIDTGDAFWRSLSDTPFDDVKLPADEKARLKQLLFVQPLPFVKEVIFLATPQQGSYLAGPQFVRRLAEYFVRLPSDVVRMGTDLATVARPGTGSLALQRMPTSIDNMSPGNRFIKTLASVPVSQKVIAHSIIAVDSDDPLDVAGDGVVKYQSAHITGVDSELIVRSPHSGMQDAAETVEEVRRIFLAHSARSACPVAAD